jgi:hypothetical protein
LQKAAADGVKSTLLGIFVNFGLAIVKVSAGLLGHSFALVADGLQSSADVLSGLVVYFGLKIAVKQRCYIVPVFLACDARDVENRSSREDRRDLSVPHELLLHSQSSPGCIQPRAIRVAKGVPSDMPKTPGRIPPFIMQSYCLPSRLDTTSQLQQNTLDRPRSSSLPDEARQRRVSPETNAASTG